MMYIFCFLIFWGFENFIKPSNFFEFVFVIFESYRMNAGIKKILFPSMNKDLPEKVRNEVSLFLFMNRALFIEY